MDNTNDSVQEDSDVDDSANSLSFKKKVSEVMKLASIHWRWICDDVWPGWKKCANILNALSYLGRLDRISSELLCGVNVLVQSINLDWEYTRKVMRGAIVLALRTKILNCVTILVLRSIHLLMKTSQSLNHVN